jgi:hypothetical protein
LIVSILFPSTMSLANSTHAHSAEANAAAASEQQNATTMHASEESSASSDSGSPVD